MKKLILIAGLLILLSCEKKETTEIICVQCKDLGAPDNIVPGYCATPDMVDEYLIKMAKVKWANKPRYKCERVK